MFRGEYVFPSAQRWWSCDRQWWSCDRQKTTTTETLVDRSLWISSHEWTNPPVGWPWHTDLTFKCNNLSFRSIRPWLKGQKKYSYFIILTTMTLAFSMTKVLPILKLLGTALCTKSVLQIKWWFPSVKQSVHNYNCNSQNILGIQVGKLVIIH